MATKSFCSGGKGGRNRKHQGLWTALALGSSSAKTAAQEAGWLIPTGTIGDLSQFSTKFTQLSCLLVCSRGGGCSSRVSSSVP